MRLTKWDENLEGYIVNSSQVQYNKRYSFGASIEKLAKYENLQEDLVKKQDELSQKLQKLRAEGKTHTATFKQLLGTKLINAQLIIMLGIYGLQE